MLKSHVLVFMFHPFRATNKNETAISCGTVVSNGWGGRVPLGTLYGFQMSQTDGGGFQGRVPPPEFEMIFGSWLARYRDEVACVPFPCCLGHA